MPYDGQPITYRYKHFPLPGGNTMLCISLTPEDEAPLDGDSILWTNLIANAIKKHGQGRTLGILKVGNQTHVPEPLAGSMKVIWNAFKDFANDRPADDESDWPQDSDVATR